MKKILPSQLQKTLNEVNVLFSKGNINASEKILNELAASFPSHPEVLSKLGTIYLYQDKLNDGIHLIKKSLEANPYQPDVLNNYAVALLNSGQKNEALQMIERSIQLNPDYIDAYYHKGIICKELNLLDDALFAYKKTIDLDPNHLFARINAAVIFIELKNYSFALSLLTEALKINNLSAGIYYNLGLTYLGLKEFNLTIDSINKAISIKSDYFEAYNVKGLALKNLYLYEEALINFDKAISLNSESYEAYNNKGLVFEEMKFFDQAILAYKKAADNNVGYEDPEYNLSLLFLSNLEFNKGWPLYEKREQIKEFLKLKEVNQKPYLESIPLEPKSILIFGEQGIGDQILFSSILHDLLKLNHKIILKIDPRLIPLFKRSFKECIFLSINDKTEVQDYDFQALMGSLLRFFRNDEAKFNKNLSSFLIPDTYKSNLLKSKINENNKLICGISWLSKNEEIGNSKSLSLNQLLPILSLKNIIFVDLQYGDTSNERIEFEKKFNIHVNKFEEIDNFNDIDDLTSLIDACDFIITISNVTAHLAGAIGKKTYLMTPYSRGKIWYWHQNQVKSIWYPCISIFKAPAPNNWDCVINEIKEDIESLYLNE